MKNLAFILCFILIASSAKAQEKTDQTFNIFTLFPVNVIHLYDMTESTVATRTYSDGSEVKYNKEVVYHMSMRAPDKPSEGFQMVNISIDSLKYKFSDAKDKIDYNSQSNEMAPPFRLFDYEKSSVILGNEYFMEYNPYYEVIEIGGNRLEEQLYRIKDPQKGMRDSLKKFVWLSRLSDDNLVFTADLRKGLFPPFRAKLDTTWKTEVYLEIEGVSFLDSVEVTFTDYSVRNYHLQGKSFNITALDKDAVLHLIKTRSEVLSGEGNVEYDFKVNPRGVINSLDINIDATFKLRINNEVYDQHYKTSYKWELINMLKYE